MPVPALLFGTCPLAIGMVFLMVPALLMVRDWPCLNSIAYVYVFVILNFGWGFVLICFFPRAFFRKRLYFKLFYGSISKDRRTTRGKNPGPRCLGRWGKSAGRKWACRLPPGFGSSWDDGLREWRKSHCEHLVWLGPRNVAAKVVKAARACSGSCCNALLVDGGCLSSSLSCSFLLWFLERSFAAR